MYCYMYFMYMYMCMCMVYVCHSGMNEHLKLTAEANLRAKQARLTTPYETRKNIVTKGATELNFPMKRVSWMERVYVVKCVQYTCCTIQHQDV